MRFLVFSIFIFLITWCFETLPKNFLSLPIFRIKKIDIETKSKKLLKELTPLAQSLYNKNIWEIDIPEIKKTLERDVRIKNIEITTPQLGYLNIKIGEQTPKYYVQIGSKIYIVDKMGEIFGYLRDRDIVNTYLIKGNNEQDIKKILKICNIVDENMIKNIISQIYIQDKDCVNIVLCDGTIIKTDFSVEDKKYKIVESLYNSIKVNNKIKYIDIRFDDYIVSEEKKDEK